MQQGKKIMLFLMAMLLIFTLLRESFILILFILLLFVTLYWFILEIELPANINKDNQIDPYSHINTILSEIKCEDDLGEEIDKAIKNRIIPDFNKFDIKQLKFMLYYATTKKELLLRRISDFKKLIYAGVALSIVPFFKILFYNYGEVIVIWGKLYDSILNVFYLIVTIFFPKHSAYIYIILLWIIVLISSPLVLKRNNRFNVIIIKNKKLLRFYRYIVLGILALFFIISSLLADKETIIYLIPGLFLFYMGFSEVKYIGIFLKIDEEIILHLNKHIIRML